MSMDGEVALDSPPFTPPELNDFAARGFERTFQTKAATLDVEAVEILIDEADVPPYPCDYMAAKHRAAIKAAWSLLAEVKRLREHIALSDEMTERSGAGRCGCTHAPCRHDAARFIEERDAAEKRAEEAEALVGAARNDFLRLADLFDGITNISNAPRMSHRAACGRVEAIAAARRLAKGE